jgi:hypothetical protein
MTKPVDLESLEARHKAATPGPWGYCEASDGKCPCGVVWAPDGETAITESEAGGLFRSGSQVAADGASIVALHNAFPAMAAEMRALREVRDAAKASMVCQCNGGSGCPWSRLHVALAALSETP